MSGLRPLDDALVAEGVKFGQAIGGDGALAIGIAFDGIIVGSGEPGEMTVIVGFAAALSIAEGLQEVVSDWKNDSGRGR